MLSSVWGSLWLGPAWKTWMDRPVAWPAQPVRGLGERVQDKECSSIPCMFREPVWGHRCCAPWSHLDGGVGGQGVKGPQLREAETPLKFQESRKGKQPLGSCPIDHCPRAHSCESPVMLVSGWAISKEKWAVILYKSWESPPWNFPVPFPGSPFSSSRGGGGGKGRGLGWRVGVETMCRKLESAIQDRRSGRKKINHIGSPPPHPPTVGLRWKPGEASPFNPVQSFYYYVRLDF